MFKKIISLALGALTLSSAFMLVSCNEKNKEKEPSPASFYFLLKDGNGKEYKLKHVKGDLKYFVYEEYIEYNTSETTLDFTVEGPFRLSDDSLISDAFYEIQRNDFVEFTVDASRMETYPAEILVNMYDYAAGGSMTYAYTAQFYVEINVTVPEDEGLPDDVPSDNPGGLLP